MLELKEKIIENFRSCAPDACSRCGSSLQGSIMAIEEIFATHVLDLIKEAGYLTREEVQSMLNILVKLENLSRQDFLKLPIEVRRTLLKAQVWELRDKQAEVE